MLTEAGIIDYFYTQEPDLGLIPKKSGTTQNLLKKVYKKASTLAISLGLTP